MEPLHDRGPTVYAVVLALVIVTTIFTVLRVISKLGITRKATADDFVAMVAWALDVGLSITIMVGTKFGLGAPDSEIPPRWELPLQRCIYAFTVLYHPALTAMKSAILVLYLRLGKAHPFLRRSSLFTLAIVILSGTVLTFLFIFQCRPVAAAFKVIQGSCIDVVSLFLSSAPVDILTDIAIILLPLPFLTSLRIDLGEKIVLVAMFLLGGFVAVVDVVRIVYLQSALQARLTITSSGTITAGDRPPNYSYYISFTCMWSAVVVSVGITCSCILVLKPLALRIMPDCFHKSSPQHTGWLLQSAMSPDGHIPEANQSDDTPSLSPTESTARQQETRHSEPVRGSTGVQRRPSPVTLLVVPEEEESEPAIDFFEMLATEPPESYPEGRPRQHSLAWRSSVSESRRNTIQAGDEQAPTQKILDFVNIQSKKPLTELNAREALWPVMFVSSLFFMWGFARGVIYAFNGQIQTLLGYSSGQIVALNTAYWAAYFFGPLLVGYWVLKYEGFKATFITGLCIYAVGSMAFWPSSVLRSYPGFFVSNFIIPFGLSCLEVAANPYIALAGPGELSEARLNFAQGIQGIGGIISPLIANSALLSGLDYQDLFRVQWCYLAVAFFVTLLALVFFYVPLSEASDEDLESMVRQRLENAHLDRESKVFGIGARSLILWTGVSSMFVYLGAQQGTNNYWNLLVSDVKPGSPQLQTYLISRGVFTFGRFLGAGLAYVGVPPRIFLGVYTVGGFVCSVLALLLPQGSAALTMLILAVFFTSTMFPTLFSMILRGQGRHTKFAAAAVTMAISGGAVWPAVIYGIGLHHPNTSRYPLLVASVLLGVLLLWPTLMSSRRTLRRWVDPTWSKSKSSAGQGYA